jgi:hypothetical protein
MAYEDTQVPVARSQEAIRSLVMRHGGFGFAAVSERDPSGEFPSQEGFHAKVMIDAKPYAVKIMAQLKKAGRGTEKQRQDWTEREERRVWRVLYYHIKSVFEAADSGVMEFRELMLPFILVPDGRTIAEHILPQLDAKLAGNPSRLLGNGEQHA